VRAAARAIGVVLWLATARAHAEAPARTALVVSDFAYGADLQIAENAAVQTLLVPLDVYRHSLRGDLADVRVFNGRAEEVPHAIRTLDQGSTVEHGERSLALFPIFEPAPGDGSLVESALHVERSANGTVIDIRSSPRAGAQARDRIVAYVLDASALEHEVVALRVELASAPRSYSLPFAVEASDDLTHWRTLASAAVLAQLEYAQRTIRRDRIEFTKVRARFMRLTWAGGELPSQLIAVHAELVPGEAPAPRERRRVRGRASAAAPGTTEFDLGGPLPVERVEVLLSEPNTLIEAELESSATRTGRYLPAFAGQIYRVKHQGHELASPPVDVAPRRHRYFRLRATAKGGGLGGQVPDIEVEYVPDQLLFIARGPQPFKLAYGSHAARASAFDSEQVLAVIDVDAREQLPRQSARAAPARSLGGPKALMPPPQPRPLRTYALWAVLVTSTLVLAALAIRLLRQLG